MKTDIYMQQEYPIHLASPTSIKSKNNQSAIHQNIIGKIPPNAKVIGNYLLGKNIGQGTFGKVYLALHIPTGERVAVKIIDKSKMRPKDVIRVKNQLTILKCVRHRNIIHLYEILETQKSLLLITEYLAGGQLFRYIIKEKRLNQLEACRFFQQIIAGVQYLHKNGIAHRDLKPENILIDYDKQLKIIDFGLSAQYECDKELNTFCGSPCYAAPEIIEALTSYSPLQADLWSCGVILFAMITGYLPFCDADTHTLYKKVRSGAFKTPAHVSQSAKNLIEGLLVVSPQKRLSINQIKKHSWFNQIKISPAFGLNHQERLRCDIGLIKKMKMLNIPNFQQQSIRLSLMKCQKTKQTACYQIFMKKIVKQGGKVSSYLGSDMFNPDSIQNMDEDKVIYDNDTETPNQEDGIYKIPVAPMQNDSLRGSENRPNPESIPNDLSGQYDQHFQKCHEQSMTNIIKAFICEKESIEQTELSKLKSLFYANNQVHKFGKINIHESESVRKKRSISPQGKKYGFKKDLICKIQKIARNKKISSQHQIQVNNQNSYRRYMARNLTETSCDEVKNHSLRPIDRGANQIIKMNASLSKSIDTYNVEGKPQRFKMLPSLSNQVKKLTLNPLKIQISIPKLPFKMDKDSTNTTFILNKRAKTRKSQLII